MAKWKGKAIGAGLGFLFLGGPLGAIFGAMTGSFFDASAQRQMQAGRPRSDHEKSLNFITHLVGILISIAKADGRVSTHEIKVIERAFVSFGFKGEDLNFIRDLINQTVKVDLNLQAVCYEFKQYSSYEERLSLLRIVYMVAFADKEFHANEESVINSITGFLEISVDDAFEIRGEFCSDHDKHYRLLNTTRNASIEEIKKAYRLLSKKYHPDRVSHLGDEFAQLASEKFQKINESYEKIKSEKGF
ncbi:MAG: DnaJ domain-containing protein [Candidatus Brocadiaceae bacterium]|nr:DnaJ domain-containing protein [Candidatus Brocadiaceae bacterium]